MTKPRKRRPTFSGTQGSSVDSRRLINDDHDDGQDGLMPGVLNQRRGTRYTPSSFVERWIRRNSLSQAEQPMLRHEERDRAISSEALFDSHTDDEDFAVGIPIDAFPMQNTPSNSDSMSLKSKPSTRRSSMDSSIDDVCMPLDDEEKEAGTAMGIWPDTAILDEFAKKELEEQANAEAAALVRESVNEAADAVKDGRLRPHRYAPWDKSNVLRAQSSMRFTYFRDDLPATLHSPSIAGLLQDGQSFADLFPPPEQSPFSMADPLVQGVAQSAAQGAAQGATQGSIQGAAQGAAQGAMNAANTAGASQPSGMPSSSNNTHLGAQRASSQAPNAAPSGPNSAGNPYKPSSNLGSTTGSPPPPGSIGKDPFPDIQPDPNTMAKLAVPQSRPHHHHQASGGTTSIETGSEYAGPWWLDINSPTEEEMRVISRAFGIHPLTTEDIVLHEKREKVELFHNYYFVCFTSFDVTVWESGSSNTKNTDSSNDGDSAQVTSSDQRRRRGSTGQRSTNSNKQSRRRGRRVERLKPLAVFSIVFKSGIITVHYKPTPHTINVRRRIRLLRDYLNVSSDWISYALIDDITDGFGPLIAAADEDVQAIDDAIMRMHSHSDDDDGSDDEVGNTKSTISSFTGSSSTGYREWRQKGDMLRWIGESRKRVMSLLSLLSNKRDVIKGFSKRVGEHWGAAPRSEIAMYLSDIQDHLVTMTQSLNHYEKQLARSHSNYLAQINIDMTRTNNDMNDVLSKISMLGTIVLPMNIVTGLWGMNVLVPGQDDTNSLRWFYGIVVMMIAFGISAYFLIMRYV